MKEMIDFRVPEKNAARYLPDDLGQRLGDSVRKVMVRTDTPLFREFGRLGREFRARGEFFFFGTVCHRYYTRRELEKAELFCVRPTRFFEPAGEQCGTQYDESTACPECGAGAIQVSGLRLDLRKVPRTADFAETIAGEQVVSQRFAECWTDAGLAGIEFRPVRHKARYEDDAIDLARVPAGREILSKAEAAGFPHPTGSFWVWLNRPENRVALDKATDEYVAQKKTRERRRGSALPAWHQLIVTSPPVEITPPTRAGETPFDENSYGRCSRGDLIGLNLLSEVTVARSSLSDFDVMVTRQMVGTRRGLLRPSPILLFSPRARRLVKESKLKGFKFEVAHLS